MDKLLEKIENLVDRASDPKQIAGHRPFVVIPANHTVQALDKLLENPTRKVGNPAFIKSTAFCEYVNEQKEESSRLYVTSPTQVLCVIDHHAASAAGWGQHRVTFNLTKTREWLLWNANDKVQKGQREFAQFIEDNMDDVCKPSGGELLDLIRTVKASQNLDCSGEIDEKGDTKSASFVIQTRTKAGAKSELDLPQEFTLLISPYEGGEKLFVKARLRLKIQEPKLLIWFELVKVEAMEKSALEDIVDSISEKIGLSPWYGTP